MPPHGHGAGDAFARGLRHQTHARIRHHVFAQPFHFGLRGSDERILARVTREDSVGSFAGDAVGETAFDEAAVLPHLIDGRDRER